MSDVHNEIRKAIENCGKSRYAIAKETGISEAQLSRVMSGKSRISIPTLELLLDHLELEVVIRPKKRKRKGK